MRDMGVVHGSEGSARPLIIGKDTVYVHTNIQKNIVEYDMGEDPETGEKRTVKYDDWTYNEIQYTYPEYLKLQADSQNQLQESVTNTQLAILELYESMG